MKIISDDVLTCAYYLREARLRLEQELMEVKDLLGLEDLPAPPDRFKLAWSMADALQSDVSLAGDVGLTIADIVEALECLAEELPND